MAVVRRIFISLPADMWLSRAENDLKWAIVERIEKLGYTAEIFFDPRPGQTGLSSGEAWTADKADHVMRRCVGAVILGLPRWKFPSDSGAVHLPTEYNHYEGALAHTLGLPMLVFVQQDVLRRVVFDNTYKGFVGVISSDANRDWFRSDAFRTPFEHWKRELENRRDIFLGYCSTSTQTAIALKRFLKASGRTVLDWRTDFKPARFILSQIEEAAARCSAGIFLFTPADQLAAGGEDKAVPRDNVLFEAGYFINSKGKDRVLIVRQAGAKMPADLGGDIYAFLKSSGSIASITGAVKKFCAAL